MSNESREVTWEEATEIVTAQAKELEARRLAAVEREAVHHAWGNDEFCTVPGCEICPRD